MRKAKLDLCEKEIIIEYVRPEYVKSFELMMKGFFWHLPEKNLYVETVIEVLGGQTNEQEDYKNKCGELDDEMKIGIELIALTYIHNNTSYTKEHKHSLELLIRRWKIFFLAVVR